MYKNKAVICWTCEISSFHLTKRQQLCLHQFYAVSWAVLKPTIFTSLNVLAYRVKLDSIHRQIWRPRLNIIKKNSRANFCFVCFKHSDYLKNFEYPTSSINFQWNFSLQICALIVVLFEKITCTLQLRLFAFNRAMKSLTLKGQFGVFL